MLGAFFSMLIKAIASPSVLSGRVIQGSLMIIISALSIFIFVKRIGYKSAEFSIKHIIVAVGLIVLIRQILGYATGYVTYISGGTYDIANAICFGETEITLLDDSSFTQTIHWVMLGVDILINLPVCILAERIGVNQRKRDRIDMGYTKD